MKSGFWVQYNFDGVKLSEGHFERGKQNGVWTRWHDAEQVMFTGAFNDDQEDGPC